MTGIKQKSKRLGTKKPMLREISFEGNMASTYEKNLRRDLAKAKR